MTDQDERYKLVIHVHDVCHLWLQKENGTTTELEKAIVNVFSNEVKEEGNFLCNWCGELYPIDERREITDNSEHLIWVGCVECHKRKMRLDNATE
jgi:hypothetical protein